MDKDLKQLIAETIKTTFAAAPEKLIERGIREIQYDICPHCKTEIYERHEYTEDGGTTWRHSECKGLISRPETPIEKINDWLRPYVAEARAQRNSARKELGMESGLPLSGDEKYIKQQQNQSAPMPANVTGLPENRVNPTDDPYQRDDDESGRRQSPDNDPASPDYDPRKPTMILHPHPESVPQHGVNEMEKSENEESKPVGARDYARFANGMMNFVNSSNLPLKVTVTEFTVNVSGQSAKTYIVRVDNG